MGEGHVICVLSECLELGLGREDGRGGRAAPSACLPPAVATHENVSC